MNVLHISRRFYPCMGGTEKYIHDISTRLMREKVNCKGLVLNYDVLDRKSRFKKFEIIDHIEVNRISGFGFYKKPLPLNLPIKLFKWADIIHLHDIRFLYELIWLLKPFFRYKIVISTHGFIFHTKYLKKIKSFLFNFYYKKTFNRFVDRTICVSKQDYRYFKENGFKKIKLIENGITINKSYKIKKDFKQGKFLYLGRIDNNKGLDLLFKVLKFVKDLNWNLDILGYGPKTIINNLKSISKESDIFNRIYWHGVVVDEKIIHNFLEQAHICFFPSVYEGFGFTLLEAMAVGNLCIANDNTSYRDLINNGRNAFLVNFQNPEEVENKIRDLYNIAGDNLENIYREARETADSFNWDYKIKEIIDVYQKIL